MTLPDIEPGLFELNDKPPYHVASMEERKAIPRNGLVAVSTFSGCGGSSLGLKAAGYAIPYAVEFVPAARETYERNAPETYVDARDIRTIDPDEILQTIGLQRGELDLFEGSPPCSSFSASGAQTGRFEDNRGKVKAYSDGIKQATDDLFDEWLRMIVGLRPKSILAENVPELAAPGARRRELFRILAVIESLGYNVHAAVYSSLNAGAATMRKRLIIMGVRRDIGACPRPVLTGNGYTLREALAAIPLNWPDDLPADELAWSDLTSQASNPGEPYSLYEKWLELKPGEDHKERFNLKRVSWDRPVKTFTAAGKAPGAAQVTLPDIPRGFTATEAKWLSGFPLDFELTGNPGQRYERIARAVTPPLYQALAPHLARALGA